MYKMHASIYTYKIYMKDCLRGGNVTLPFPSSYLNECAEIRNTPCCCDRLSF